MTANEDYRLFFFKTRVGAEQSLVTQLGEALRPYAFAGRTYLTLGGHDLLLIVRGQEAQRELMEHGTLTGVVRAAELPCDPIFGDVSVLLGKPDTGILALTQLRIQSLFRAKESEPTEVFLKWWHNTGRAEEGTVLLSTYGGPPFAVLSTHASLEAFHVWIKGLSQESRIVASTHSVLALGKRRVFMAQDQGTLALPPDFEIQLALTWNPESEQAIHLKLKEYFKNSGCDYRIRYHSGDEDCTVTFYREADASGRSPGPTLEGFVSRLLQFRKAASMHLRSTRTSLQFAPRASQFPPSQGGRQWQSRAFLVTRAEAKRINGLQDIGPSVLRFFYEFSNLTNDQDMASVVFDMLPYCEALKRTVVSLATREDELITANDLRHVAGLLRDAREGVGQRVYGSDRPLSTGTGFMRQPLGGMSRILQAATAVPLHVIEMLSNREAGQKARHWNGMVNIGPFRDFVTKGQRLIALPEGFAQLPNRWTSLVHESIHIYASMHAESLRPIEKALDMLQLKRLATVLRRELLADILDLHFSPFWEPHLWFFEFWQYALGILGDRRSTENEELWLRTTLAFSFVHAKALTRGGQQSNIDPLKAYKALGRKYVEWKKDVNLRSSYEASLSYEDPKWDAIWDYAIAEHQKAHGGVLHFFGRHKSDAWRAVHHAVAPFLVFDAQAIDERAAAWNGLDARFGSGVPEDFMSYGPCPALVLWKLWRGYPGHTVNSARRAAVVHFLETLTQERARMRWSALGKEGTRAPHVTLEMGLHRPRLGDILARMYELDDADIERVALEAQESGTLIGQALVVAGVVSLEQLEGGLQRQHSYN